MVQNIVSTEPENGEFLSGLRMDFSQVLNSARKDVPPSTFILLKCVFLMAMCRPSPWNPHWKEAVISSGAGYIPMWRRRILLYVKMMWLQR